MNSHLAEADKSLQLIQELEYDDVSCDKVARDMKEDAGIV